MEEDEMVVWHHGLNGHEFEQAHHQQMVMDREARCAAVHGVSKELNTTEQLNNNEEFLQENEDQK